MAIGINGNTDIRTNWTRAEIERIAMRGANNTNTYASAGEVNVLTSEQLEGTMNRLRENIRTTNSFVNLNARVDIGSPEDVFRTYIDDAYGEFKVEWKEDYSPHHKLKIKEDDYYI